MPPHLINRVTILGTGLIGGSFALALRKYTTGIHITGWDRADVVADAQSRGAIDAAFSAELTPALENADLVYIALPIGATLDLLPEVARLAAPNTLVTDACSTKLRIIESAVDHFADDATQLFLGGHPMAGRELSGIAHADADLFRNNTYALIGATSEQHDPRVSAFVKILEKIGARPLWLGAQQHDYAVGLASHLPQLAAVALGVFSLRSSRRKRSPHHASRPRPPRFSPPSRQPLLHLARHRPDQQRSPLRRPRSLRPPPRRSPRTPSLSRPRSRLRRRQRTLQTPPLLVGARHAVPVFLLPG